MSNSDHPRSDASASVAERPGRRVAVRVTPAGLRAVRSGDPWLFDGSITSVSPADLPTGSVAIVFDDRRRVAGVGLWDPDSPIRVKMLHAGPVEVGPELWSQRFTTALACRQGLVDDPDTTAWRWVHGENDGLPGLVVDRYADTLVIKLYTAAWFPHLDQIVTALGEIAEPERIVLRLSRRVSAQVSDVNGLGDHTLSDGSVLVGTVPTAPIRFTERGLVMEADVIEGHKTGHFLDQRDNHALVRSMADGAHVLDVFSSTGGFSVAAAAGGARSVHMVDISRPALDTARRNLAHNRHIAAVARCEVTDACGDAFEVLDHLARQGREFDLVIIDPPSFAQNEAAVPRALAAYRRLVRAGLAVTAAGGTLVQASCSSRVDADQLATAVADGARGSGKRVREIRRTGHPVDHPIGFDRGGYLTAVYAAVAAAV
jgi:23S rRNA (cytosine1962-C5)-methyltransferase